MYEKLKKLRTCGNYLKSLLKECEAVLLRMSPNGLEVEWKRTANHLLISGKVKVHGNE
jgi:hypothetical protein